MKAMIQEQHRARQDLLISLTGVVMRTTPIPEHFVTRTGLRFPLLAVLALGMAACFGSQGSAAEARAARPTAEESAEPSSMPIDRETQTAASDAPQAEPARETTTTEPTDVQRDGLQAFARAKPIFVRYCSSCHTSDGDRASKGALKHFDMDSYPFGGHHANDITSTIRAVLGVGGASATMPRDRPGSVQGEDLRLIITWADAYDRDRADPQRSENIPKTHHH